MEDIVRTNVHNKHTRAYWENRVAPMQRLFAYPPRTAAMKMWPASIITVKRYPHERGTVETYVR